MASWVGFVTLYLIVQEKSLKFETGVKISTDGWMSIASFFVTNAF